MLRDCTVPGSARAAAVTPPESPRISQIGTRAILFEAPGAFELGPQKRIWALADEVGAWPHVEEAAPGVTNLLIVFTRPPRDREAVFMRLLDAWERLPPKTVSGRVIEVPVVYGGELGHDLAAVSAFSGLAPEEVIRIHREGTYTVLCMSSSPGFGYLHGLDPRIFMPRKKVPSLRMLAGTVTIGGMQAGISVNTGPNGWNSIGFTAMPMFDPARDPPALLMPGDTIRFVAERIEL